MCIDVLPRDKPISVSSVVIVTPYKDGGKTGNLPSMRVAIRPEDISYNSPILSIRNILPEVTIETVQNTNSMEPFIDIGHTLILSNNQKYKDALTVGNVIIFNAGGYRVIHAIIETNNNMILTQGWNLKEPDPQWIGIEQVESVLLAHIPTKEHHGMKPGDND